MEQTFEEYLKQARKDFAKVAAKYSAEEHLELRTAIDSLLIAYDQAVDQALSIANVVEHEVQLCRFCKVGDTNNDFGCTNPKCEMYPFQ